jgi:hypothetical protein
MKAIKQMMIALLVVGLASSPAWAAYHHAGEADADKVLSVYPDKAGTKLDHCALCHTGGQYTTGSGRVVTLGSCQWCHYTYGYHPPHGDINATMNAYGQAYRDQGRSTASLTFIENLDSDNDTYANIAEINAIRYPGDPADDPSKVAAPYRIYTRAQIEAMTAHTQFMLMNTSRSGDEYTEYTGVPIRELLDDAGILQGTATNIVVFSVDGWSQTHPLEYVDPAVDEEAYHVYGNMPGQTYQYPPAVFYYDEDADVVTNPNCGWCEYDASSCVGRSHLDPINVTNGLKAILAYTREGVYLDPGILNDNNKLDGEGPFRVVVPQKIDPPPPPDQSSRAPAECEAVLWPYDEMGGDHNAGACSKSATIIKVEPLPPGTTDIDILEAGWSYVDNNKIIIYGAIDGTDADGDGVLASEEGAAADADSALAMVREANGGDMIQMETASGAFQQVACLMDDDPAVPQANKPASIDCPFGALRFEIDNLVLGETVDVTLTFPGNVPTDARYYKIHPVRGWVEIPFGSNDGDSTIVLTLKDGDPDLDADGVEDGKIVDPGAVTVASASTSSSGGGSGGCFVATAAYGSYFEAHVKILRQFRDTYLLSSHTGRAIVAAYYRVSPRIADVIAGNEILKTLTRWGLAPVVGMSWVAVHAGLGVAGFMLVGGLTLIAGVTLGTLRYRRRRIT